MAEDANARIRVDIDTAAALANIKNLQRQISAFHTSLAKGGAAAAATSLNMQQGLLNSINQTGKFSATIKNVKSTTDSFTDSLQKNKLSMGEYFRYAGASTKTFGSLFRTEFDTINKVARERVKDLQTQYIKMGRDANGAMRAIAVRPLALDMENLGTKTQIAAQRQALLNQLLKQGSTNLLNFGKNTQWAGRQLMVGFTVPLVMLGSVAAKTFMDMEKQAVRFKRVYGEMFTTSGETEKALQEIKNLANEFTKYGVAVSKTMELAADIAATGKMGAELTAQVAETTRLAVLGGVEQAEALQATISLTDAFGVSAEELAGKIDFLNAVENQTITSIEDLTIAIPKAGPVVKQLGGDVEDLTFFLTAMREGGINASEGANALKSGLAALINPTRQASEMLSGFGINIKGIVEANAGDVKGLVLDFASSLDTLDPLNRARAIEQLFGKFQFSRLSTLFQNVIKDGNQASRVLKLTNATTEELAVLSEREMKRIEDSPMFKFQKALEDIKVTLVPLGEAFLKAVTPLLEFGTSILKKFNELDEGAKGFVVGLTAIAGVIGPVFLMGFGLIANGVANIIKMFTFFKTSMNKTGSASAELGMQTEYMTQQQLEASAVAASLDQVHQKLRQTFTSETAAVNALTAAYQKAIAAQAAMTGGAITRTRPGVTVTTNSRGGRRAQAPQGYASGVLSVPGPKGAGDVVPAMLSPGEAVIPARQAQKYSGFISSMIADNVPGFRFGRNPFAKFKSAVKPEGSKYGMAEGFLRLMTGNRLGPHGSEPNFWQDSIANKFIRSNPKIAVRIQDKDLMSLIGSKDKRYKSVFETKKSNAGDTEKERAYAEEKLFGLPQDVDPSKRPTYGYMFNEERGQRFIGRKQSLFNRLTGKKDRSLTRSAYQNIFKSSTASLMNPKTFRYGNAAMVLKNRNIKDRTTFTYGDSYNRSLDRFGTPAKLGTRNKDDIKGSYTSKDKDFFEAQIMGGFTLKDVRKIVVTEPQLVPLLQQALRQQGLKIPVGMPKFTMLQKLRSVVSNAGLYGTTRNPQGNRINHRYENNELPITQKDGSYGIKEERYIRRPAVTGPQPELNLAARLFKKLGVPGYEGGAVSVQSSSLANKFASNFEGRADLDLKTKQRINDYLSIKDRSRRTVPQSLDILSKFPPPGVGTDVLARLGAFGVGGKDTMKIMSALADFTDNKYPATKLASAKEQLFSELNSATKDKSGLIKKSSTLTSKFRSVTGWRPNNAGSKAFAHLGSGAKLTASEILALHKSGQLNLKPDEIKLLQSFEKNNSGYRLDLKTALGMGGIDSRLNSKLDKGTALKSEMLDGFQKAGPGKWQAAIAFGGGKLDELDLQVRKFDSEFEKLIKSQPEDTLFTDSEEKAIKLRAQNKNAVSLTSLYGAARANIQGLAPNLFKVLDAAHSSATEVRASGQTVDEEMARAGVKKNPFVSPGKDRAVKSTGPLSVLKKASIAELLLARRGFRFANGVVSVPGPKGAGDVIPAMLSPGEAVIPTKMASKYSPLINSMIDGNVPGYESGKLAPPKFDSDPLNVSTQQTPSTPSERKSFGNAIGAGFGKAREVTKALASSTTSVIKNVVVGDIDKNTGLLGKLGRSAAIGLGNLGGNRVVDSTGKVLTGPEAGAAKSAAAAGSNSSRRTPLVAGGARQQADPNDPNSRRGSMAGKIAGGASMVGMGAMMYGMSGGPGADIAMMASMPLMMAQMMGKFAPVILGLGGIAIAAFALKGAFDQAQTSTLKLNEALGTGDAAVEEFADFAGKASAGEVMDKRRANALLPFAIQTGKSTFGQSFIQSEQGQGMAAATKESISKLGRSGTEAQLVTQLVNAVSSGALDAGQARSIVSNIAKEIGDTSFGLNVNARLVELLGVNGENLLEDPLTIRIKLAEDSEKQIGIVAGKMQELANPFQVLGEAALLTGEMAGVGALAGGSIGTFFGGPAGTGIGGAIGAVAGTVAGLATTGPQVVSAFANMGTASASVVASSKMALQQQQQLLDSLDLDYEKRIAIAEAAGDLAKAERLTNQYMIDRQDLLKQGAETRAAIASSFESADFSGKMALQEAAKKSIENRYKDDADGLALAMGARQQVIDASGLNDTQEYMLTIGLASDLDPLVISELISLFGSDEAMMTQTFTLMDNLGNADTNRTLNVMKMFKDENGEPLLDQQTKFVANISAKSSVPEEARKYLEMFESVSRVLDAEIVLTYLNEHPEAADKMLEMKEIIDSVDGKMGMDIVTDLIGEENMNNFKEYEQYFNDLPDNFQKTFMTQFVTTMLLQGDEAMQDAYRAWLNEPGNKGKLFADFALDSGYITTETQKDNTVAPADEDLDTGGGGGGPAASSLDDILKKLRDIRKNQIGVTKGFEASAAAISKLFGGGAGINLFSGIENDMRRLGAEEDLINLIVGMSPEEFEKQKNTLFNFDQQTGEIIGFKDQLQSIGRALSAIALGQYVSDQQRSAKESRNQVLAFNQLRAAGYSVADAYEAVQDAAVASAIATGNVTRDQMSTMLQELKAAQAAMKEAARLTPEGLQQVFEDGFNKAMEAFDVQEKKLTLEYELQIANDQDLIQQAQNQIAAIQYQLDDYEADLRGIEDQEDAINKTYDDKLEALEKVRQANQKVLDQEKGRLSVAEAITRGDLAATARAVQDLRQTSASGYFSSQTDALNAGRQSALDQVRSANGLSRIEIEEKIKKLTDEIFDIEEKTLEPANERIRLAGVELQSRIDELEVLGKTRTEWETIKNNIDLARVNSVGYKEAMEEARDVVQQVLDAWNGIQSKTVTLTTIQQTIKEGEVPASNLGDGDGDGDDTADKTPAEIAAEELEAQRTAPQAWKTQASDIKNRARIMESALRSVYSSDGIGKLLATYDSASKMGVYGSEYAAKAKTAYTALHEALKARGFSSGGRVMSYMADGGSALGSDTVPAMLTPGEFVVRRPMVNKYGSDILNRINSGSMPLIANSSNMSTPRFASVGSTASVNQSSVSSRQAAAPSSNSVYNYNLSVNVASQSDPNAIAQTVMAQLQRVDSQRVRNGRF